MDNVAGVGKRRGGLYTAELQSNTVNCVLSAPEKWENILDLGHARVAQTDHRAIELMLTTIAIHGHDRVKHLMMRSWLPCVQVTVWNR